MARKWKDLPMALGVEHISNFQAKYEAQLRAQKIERRR